MHVCQRVGIRLVSGFDAGKILSAYNTGEEDELAKVRAKRTPVLVRHTSTTTYHFGLRAPICEEGVTESDAVPESWALADALDHERRLCRDCADLVESWTAAVLSEASATDIVHPAR